MIWYVILAPLLGAILNGLVLRKANKLTSHIVACASMGIAFLCAISVYANFLAAGGEPIYEMGFSWLSVGNFEAPFKVIIDRLSMLMTLIITGIGFLIHVYAGGYMHEEAKTNRFFCYLNLFVFMMLLLVLGENLILMFVGWEGVGLCSYLLIGYWFEDDANAAAGMKAFIVNRIGDIGFLLGIFLTFKYFSTVSFSELRNIVTSSEGLDPALVSVIGVITLCFFVGACGKSAQLPLYVWLPDAMAGPTPVSALIHAATMVTAGVYMMTRLNFFYYLAPNTMMVVATVGALTAFFAATIALVQKDIKKVLAYSTVSQLGYMVLACGVGAFGAGVFHLLTHACFKALLFLGAGSVIVAMHHKQDMDEMGGLKKYMPVTHKVMLVGVLAIIGFPGLSGFFSKDEILWYAFLKAPWLWGIAAVTAGLTAFYMVRLLMLTFYGENRSDHHTKEHLHETPAHMYAPLIVLAILSAGIGYLGVPEAFGVTNLFHHYLEPVIAIPSAAAEHWAFLTEEHSHTMEFGLMGVSVAIMFVSSGFAVINYRNGPSSLIKGVKSTFSGLHNLLTNKYWVDEGYFALIVAPLKDLAMFCYKVVDVVIIDGLVNGVASLCEMIGGLLSFKMSGSLHRHGMVIVLGMICLLSAMVF
ncbi:MAG: NADH-quinone oxidoreductase subunit L [Oligoflexales bacterium]